MLGVCATAQLMCSMKISRSSKSRKESTLLTDSLLGKHVRPSFLFTTHLLLSQKCLLST
jgi:hypothetical protein